jgi:putative hydrolase of the HAD superfamily
MRTLRHPIVLLDAGDTLIGPRESFGAVYARVLAELGAPLPTAAIERGLRSCWVEFNRGHTPGVDRYGVFEGGEQAYWLHFVEGTLARTPGAPKDEGFAARALEPLRDAFRDPTAWRIFDDVIPALDALQSLGARLAIVSNWDSRLPGLLDGLGLAGRFDAIVVSHLEGLEKPSPELFLRAVARLGGAPGQALHVGDVPELDEAGAQAAGIASVLVDRAGRLGPERRALPDLATLPEIVRLGRD